MYFYDPPHNAFDLNTGAYRLGNYFSLPWIIRIKIHKQVLFLIDLSSVMQAKSIHWYLFILLTPLISSLILLHLQNVHFIIVILVILVLFCLFIVVDMTQDAGNKIKCFWRSVVTVTGKCGSNYRLSLSCNRKSKKLNLTNLFNSQQ